MHKDTLLAALWAMRALRREMNDRAGDANHQGLVWAGAAELQAREIAYMVRYLERMCLDQGMEIPPC
jgi:hypothetical protein